jgi:hypothetical protein
MKKVFFIRFGMPTQTLGDQQAMDQIGARDTSVGAGSPFGIISIVGTDKSPAEIVQIYKDVAAEMQDELPIIAWLEGDQAAANLSAGFFEHFEPMNKVWENEFGRAKKECTMSLDELLDLVKQKGVKNLSTEELKRLKDLSSNF